MQHGSAVIEDMPPYKEVTAGGGDERPFITAGITTLWLIDKKRYTALHTALDRIEVCDFDRMAEGTLLCCEVAERLMAAAEGQ